MFHFQPILFQVFDWLKGYEQIKNHPQNSLVNSRGLHWNKLHLTEMSKMGFDFFSLLMACWVSKEKLDFKKVLASLLGKTREGSRLG